MVNTQSLIDRFTPAFGSTHGRNLYPDGAAVECQQSHGLTRHSRVADQSQFQWWQLSLDFIGTASRSTRVSPVRFHRRASAIRHPSHPHSSSPTGLPLHHPLPLGLHVHPHPHAPSRPPSSSAKPTDSLSMHPNRVTGSKSSSSKQRKHRVTGSNAAGSKQSDRFMIRPADGTGKQSDSFKIPENT